MSIRLVAWALEQDVPSGPKFVLVCLCNRANDDDGTCWPGLDNVAKNTNMSRRTIIRHIQTLEQLGFVRVTARTLEDGQQTSNEYQILVGGGVRLSPLPVTKTTGGGDRVSPKPSEEPSVKPEVGTKGPDKNVLAGLLVSAYQTHIAYITDPMSQTLLEYAIEHPNLTEDWISEAFQIATERNARNWGYVKAILDRWIAGGKHDLSPARTGRRSNGVTGGRRTGSRGKPAPSGRFEHDRKTATKTR